MGYLSPLLSPQCLQHLVHGDFSATYNTISLHESDREATQQNTLGDIYPSVILGISFEQMPTTSNESNISSSNSRFIAFVKARTASGISCVYITGFTCS